MINKTIFNFNNKEFIIYNDNEGNIISNNDPSLRYGFICNSGEIICVQSKIDTTISTEIINDIIPTLTLENNVIELIYDIPTDCNEIEVLYEIVVEDEVLLSFQNIPSSILINSSTYSYIVFSDLIQYLFSNLFINFKTFTFNATIIKCGVMGEKSNNIIFTL